MATILVLGAGAWGTALAQNAAAAGHDTWLWARNPAPLLARRESPRLPGVPLHPAIRIGMPDRAAAALVVSPVAHLREVLRVPRPDAPLVLCMKGLEPATHRLPLEVAGTEAAAVLTGPNFAAEVAAGLPAAAVLASTDATLRGTLMALLGSATLRLYGSADVVGAQVGGAAKNVMAIAAGATAGLGLGENARAAVVTRGLAEIGRLAEALGGSRDTVAGLSGMGDLLLTCTGLASRNYRFGLALGQGLDPARARAGVDGTVEGIGAAAGLLARCAGVDCPLVATVDALARGTVTAAEAAAALLARPQRGEGAV